MRTSPLVAIALVAAAPVSSWAAPLDRAVAQRIDRDVAAVIERADVPGAVLLVVADDQVVYRHAYGMRDREHRLPVDLDTEFEIGSITKQFTAAAILQLQEAGELSIDDRVATFLPDAPHASEVTLRQLLTHTSGLPEYLDGPDIEIAATKPTTFAGLMARIAGKPLVFAPGSKWSYCNTNYILLGRIIEVVAHDSYRHYVQAHFLDPLHMTQTRTVADEPTLPDMAVGYRHVTGRLERAVPIHDTFGWSAGHLVSTVGDLARWSAALAAGQVVSAPSYAAMSTAAMIGTAGRTNYGFGLFVDTIEDQPRIGHTGGALGFTTADEYFPRQRVRIIAFTNTGDQPEAGEIVTTAVFDDLFPAIAAASVRPAPGEEAGVTARVRIVFAELQRGTGRYDELAPKLRAKLVAGLGKQLAEQLAPLGQPAAFVFKGRRTADGLTWHDYLLRLGPGSAFKIGFGLDDDGRIASLSLN